MRLGLPSSNQKWFVVCSSPVQKLSEQLWALRWSAILLKSLLRFHDLRHEATSRLAEKLTNILELAAVTGHKDLWMLKRYYHPRAEELAKQTDKAPIASCSAQPFQTTT
ncbi:MAG TPA: tyrosine-type recombinase/integrase [Thiobacillaceae bacterium]|nr:tyrosine-type recombinase/integrase [Thiobacillaceae bacterium]